MSREAQVRFCERRGVRFPPPTLQYFLSRMNSPVVANSLESGEPGDGDGSRLVEGKVRRLWCEFPGSSAGVFGERAVTDAKHLIARLEAGHVGADGFDRSREAPARVEVLRPPEAESCGTEGVGQTGHHMPGASVHAGCAHSHHDFAVSDRGPVPLPELEDVLGGGAVLLLDDRLHASFPRGDQWGFGATNGP